MNNEYNNILIYNYFIKLLFLQKVRNVIPNTKFFFSSLVIPKIILPILSPPLSISFSTSIFIHMFFNIFRLLKLYITFL